MGTMNRDMCQMLFVLNNLPTTAAANILKPSGPLVHSTVFKFAKYQTRTMNNDTFRMACMCKDSLFISIKTQQHLKRLRKKALRVAADIHFMHDNSGLLFRPPWDKWPFLSSCYFVLV